MRCSLLDVLVAGLLATAGLATAAPAAQAGSGTVGGARATLAASASGTCAVLVDGTVACWGQQWRYPAPGRTGPTTVPGLTGIVEVAAGQNQTCALDADGRVFCWGFQGDGEVGVPGATAVLEPTRVIGLPSARAIAAGYTTTCALADTGEVWCWGNNRYGNLGSNSGVLFTATPERVVGLPVAKAVAVGLGRTCAVTASAGEVWCWGVTSANPAPGAGPNGWVPYPVPVAGISGATGVAVGERHTCARRNDGQVSCWGVSGWETASYPAVPTPVPGLPWIDAVVTPAGGSVQPSDATCGVSPLAEVWCWGGSYGGALAASEAPTVVGIHNFVAVAMGDEHTCALHAARQLWCVGSDASGQTTVGDAASLRFVDAVTAVALGTDPVVAPTRGYVPLEPSRLLETRAAAGQRGYLGPKPRAGTVIELDVTGGAVPDNAVAVALNVTAVDAGTAGFVTVWPCGQPRPLASNLNVRPGDIVPNLVISGVGAAGKVCLYTHGSADLLADLQGYVPAGASLVPVPPVRVLETRATEGQVGYIGVRPGAFTTVRLALGNAVPAAARTAFLNVTAVDPLREGFVTVWGCDDPRPATSSLNVHAGVTVANLVPVDLAAGDVCLYTTADLHLLADLQAWAAAGPMLVPIAPTRVLDTRDTGRPAWWGAPIVTAGSTVGVPAQERAGLPADSRGVVVNVTAVGPQGDGYVTVWPCGTSRPLASNLNVRAGVTTPNLVVTGVDPAAGFCVYVSTTMHVVADVVAFVA